MKFFDMKNSILFAANDNKGNVVLRNNNPAKLSLGTRISNFFTGRNSVKIESEVLNLSKNERAAIDAIFSDKIIDTIAKETNKKDPLNPNLFSLKQNIKRGIVTQEMIEGALKELRTISNNIIGNDQNEGVKKFEGLVKHVNAARQIINNTIDTKDKNLSIDTSKLARTHSIPKRIFGKESESSKNLNSLIKKLNTQGLQTKTLDKFREELKKGEVKSGTVTTLKNELISLQKTIKIDPENKKENPTKLINNTINALKAIEVGKTETHRLSTLQKRSGILSTLFNTKTYQKLITEKAVTKNSIEKIIGKDSNQNKNLEKLNTESLAKINSFTKTIDIIGMDGSKAKSQINELQNVLGKNYKKIITETLIEAKGDLKVFEKKMANVLNAKADDFIKNKELESKKLPASKQSIEMKDAINSVHKAEGQIQTLVSELKATEQIISKPIQR